MQHIKPNHLITEQRARELEAIARTATYDVMEKARQIWKNGIGFNDIRIQYDLRGTTAGKAYYGQALVKLNPILFHENTEDFIKNTIPHEIAHLLAVSIYGWSGRGHGPVWKDVMRKLGCNPARCHNYDVENAKVKRKSNVTMGFCSKCGTGVRLAPRHLKALSRCSTRCCGASITLEQDIFRQYDRNQVKKVVELAKSNGLNENGILVDLQLAFNVKRDVAKRLYTKAS